MEVTAESTGVQTIFASGEGVIRLLKRVKQTVKTNERVAVISEPQSATSTTVPNSNSTLTPSSVFADARAQPLEDVEMHSDSKETGETQTYP